MILEKSNKKNFIPIVLYFKIMYYKEYDIFSVVIEKKNKGVFSLAQFTANIDPIYEFICQEYKVNSN